MSAPVNDDSDSDDAPMLGIDLPTPVTTGAGAYRVLARKYRPQTFAELIGQDAMVQTLANAIRRGRLAHAFLMTGVRGVGKTSTARLIAKGLNCIGADGQGGPTIDPCGVCDPCVAIAEGRHIDVIEMDAASHTGVDDVREIIEAVRYAAVSARYKIYIIDEVHMLSKNAFNALLKTLEEPPAHVKFLFATTEVNKVPITVLSRCQRFDLRRLTPPLLTEHFTNICAKEGVEAEEEAIRMIAVAAEGSVRDGLSILDQAIAYADMDGEGRVTAEQVQGMLGLSDGAATRRLFAAMLGGDAATALIEVRAHYALGVEPVSMVRGLMALAHGIALRRASGVDDPALALDDRESIAGWAEQIGMARAHRLWQLLLKAHDEVTRAADPLQALEMAVLRIAHAATMPDPDDLARLLAATPGGTGDNAGVRSPPPVSQGPVASATAGETVSATEGVGTAPLSLTDIASIISQQGEMVLAGKLRHDGRPVSLTAGRLVLQRGGQIGDSEAAAMATALRSGTGENWTVELSDEAGGATVQQQIEAEAETAHQQLAQHPVVAAALAAFPDAELVRRPRAAGI